MEELASTDIHNRCSTRLSDYYQTYYYLLSLRARNPGFQRVEAALPEIGPERVHSSDILRQFLSLMFFAIIASQAVYSRFTHPTPLGI